MCCRLLWDNVPSGSNSGHRDSGCAHPYHRGGDYTWSESVKRPETVIETKIKGQF